MRRRYFVVAFVLATLAAGLSSLALWSCLAQETLREEGDRLSVLLGWKPGSVVADIGAGDGEMTLLMSERVGATGRVYSTEIDDDKLARLEELAAEKKNITALKAASETANLPPACCDSILVRRVYHHFPKPDRMGQSLLQSLKPGGRLAVIDFAPRAGLPAVEEDVPENRGGHGVKPEIIIDELTAAGFTLASQPDDWPNGDYCLIFRKPAP
jgi:predicted methyltransferase